MTYEMGLIGNQQHEEIDYVIADQDAIRKRCGSDFIAVQDRQLIDHDKDEDKLYEKLHDKIKKGKIRGDKFVLVRTLEEILNPLDIDMGGPKGYEI